MGFQLTKSVIYRVIGITDEENRDSPNNVNHPDFERSLSASSYCTPGIVFWLSEHGIEIPGVECVLLEFVFADDLSNLLGSADINDWPTEFEWDGGQYRGTLRAQLEYRNLWWADDEQCNYTIRAISSL